MPKGSRDKQYHAWTENHAIGNKPWKHVQNTEWGKGLHRNDYQMRAVTKDAHKGYQTWQRTLDDNIIKAADNAKSLLDFQTALNELYADLVSRFGSVKIIL